LLPHTALHTNLDNYSFANIACTNEREANPPAPFPPYRLHPKFVLQSFLWYLQEPTAERDAAAVAEGSSPLTGSNAHNRQPISREEQAQRAHSRMHARIAEAVALMDLGSFQSEGFCNLVEPVTKQLLEAVKTARMREAKGGDVQVGPNLVKAVSAFGPKNSLKRARPFIEGKGRRRVKGPRGENVPVRQQPLKAAATARAPVRMSLVQQCAKLQADRKKGVP